MSLIVWNRVQQMWLRSEGLLRELGFTDIYIRLVRDWCEYNYYKKSK